MITAATFLVIKGTVRCRASCWADPSPEDTFFSEYVLERWWKEILLKWREIQFGVTVKTNEIGTSLKEEESDGISIHNLRFH